MRRMLLVLAVALVMAAMVVASALPALAAPPEIVCGQDDQDEFGVTFGMVHGQPLTVSTPAVCKAEPKPI